MQAGADAFLTSFPAAADPYRQSGVGRVCGLAIAPESEVRSCLVLPPRGLALPVYQGQPLCEPEHGLDDCGKLIIDALDPHDGALVLYVAETPEECAHLPQAFARGPSTMWVQYNSATAQFRAMSLPNPESFFTQAWTGAQVDSPANYVGAVLSWFYEDDGTTTAGDHVLSAQMVELRRDPPGTIGGGRINPVPQWAKDAATSNIAANSGGAGQRHFDGPGGRRCVVVLSTTASSETDQAARTLFRFQLSRAQ